MIIFDQPMTRLALFALAVALVGCSPQKRLNRLLMKYPELRDTLEVEAIVEYVKGDTVFADPLPGETIRYVNDRLTVKYVDRIGPTSYIYGECGQDTVRIEVPVIQPERIVEKMPLLGYISLAVLALIAILALLKK